MSCPKTTPPLVTSNFFPEGLFNAPLRPSGALMLVTTLCEAVKVRVPLGARLYDLGVHRRLPRAFYFNDTLERTVPPFGLEREGLRPAFEREAVRDEGVQIHPAGGDEPYGAWVDASH